MYLSFLNATGAEFNVKQKSFCDLFNVKQKNRVLIYASFKISFYDLIVLSREEERYCEDRDDG
ncbi:hypothetical protein GCM10011445_12160 [Pseudocitrobacter faecalis]|nr:hypothetical protein GCM10011445_12160 [Pseudocitrobacter faecalis]